MQIPPDDWKPPDPDRFIGIEEVCTRLGVKKATIYKWIREGKFPQPHKFGKRLSRWRVGDLEPWTPQRGPRPGSVLDKIRKLEK